MNRFALLVVGLVIGVCAVLMVRRHAASTHAADSTATSVQPRTAVPIALSADTSLRDAPHDRSRPRFAIGDKLYDVTSTEKAAWLERNLFPAAEEMRSEPAATIRGLTARDLDGPVTAALLLRADMAARLQPELREPALARLHEAAALGSIQALRTLSAVYQDRRLRDLVLAEAYSRVASMRGDWQPRLSMYQLNQMQSTVAEIRAHALYETLERERRRRGLPPFQRDPPPGLNEAVSRMDRELGQLPADMRRLFTDR